GTSDDIRGRLLLNSFRISTVSPSSSDMTSTSDESDIPHDLEALDKSFMDSGINEEAQVVRFQGEFYTDATPRSISGIGSSPMCALLNALQSSLALKVKPTSLCAHKLGPDDSKTASYLELTHLEDGGKVFFGIGVSSNAVASRLRAVVSAVNCSLPPGHIFPTPRRPLPSRPSSAASFRMEDLVLRTGVAPRGIDPSEWREGVHA
ncbi:MAG TPA: alpha-isopropylmalate synthase regulatory domain-containing protein, partial [Chlamydiales bacterium]|nr:alpha-isopropylmalate synthase regulatory domain-containing protein [Chlamydiales bacterium]